MEFVLHANRPLLCKIRSVPNSRKKKRHIEKESPMKNMEASSCTNAREHDKRIRLVSSQYNAVPASLFGGYCD